MMRFDFLHDGLPDGIEAVRTFRIGRRYRSAAAAALAVAGTLCAIFGIEAMRLRDAAAVESRETLRFEATRVRLSAARVRWEEVAHLIDTDRRLRRLRSSGLAIAGRLVRVGNLVPPGAWLEDISPAAGGLTLRGQALDIHAVDTTLANVARAPDVGAARLVRIARHARVAAAALIGFELQLDDGP